MTSNTDISEDTRAEPGTLVDKHLSDFATAELPPAAHEFGASIDNGRPAASMDPGPAIYGGAFNHHGRRRASSIL